jgi:hypothetical protein
MDPHFNEYLAAVAGMREIYGEAGDEMPTEFQLAEAPAVAEAVA